MLCARGEGAGTGCRRPEHSNASSHTNAAPPQDLPSILPCTLTIGYMALAAYQTLWRKLYAAFLAERQ